MNDQLYDEEADRIDSERNKIGMPTEYAVLGREPIDHGKCRERSKSDKQRTTAPIPAFVA